MSADHLSPEQHCTECGMLCAIDQFHPYAACLMFRACNDAGTVNANLDAVRAYALQYDQSPAETSGVRTALAVAKGVLQSVLNSRPESEIVRHALKHVSRALDSVDNSQSSLPPKATQDIPAILFDGWAVLEQVKKISTHARRTSSENVSDVLDAIEIDCTQPWGPEAKLPEVYKTAAREALDRLRGHSWPMRVIGEPVVKAIIVQQPS